MRDIACRVQLIYDFPTKIRYVSTGQNGGVSVHNRPHNIQICSLTYETISCTGKDILSEYVTNKGKRNPSIQSLFTSVYGILRNDNTRSFTYHNKCSNHFSPLKI